MNAFFYYVLFTLGGISIINCYFAFRFRKSLQTMTTMVISMSISMSLGLTVGLLFAIIFQGNLFISTIISIIVGGIFALIVSFAFGILTSVEGLMSSLMGAMMGAMLGEMIPTHQSAFLLMFFLILSICASLLFFVVPTKSNHQNEKVTKRWLLKPLLVTIVLCLFITLGIQLSHSLWSPRVPLPEPHGHD